MREKKREDWDNGMTVAPMTGAELPAYRRGILSGRTRNGGKRVKSDVTKKEQRAMMKAMFQIMLPRLIVVLCGFGLVAVLIWLWLT